MNTKIERSYRGDFAAADRGGGVWRLSGGGAVEIELTGVDPPSARKLERARASRVAVAWTPEGASLTLVGGAAVLTVQARSATVHEPLPQLYESLPLVTLDARAKRFWRRVFLLVRIPGGRRLLGLVARRAGGPK
jgi:hypothetical protein